MQLASIEQGLEDLKAGKFLIVVDDQDRENEGDLVMPAEHVTAESVNFMVTHARGQLCMPMLSERLAELDIPLLPSRNSDSLLPTAFTMPVDYAIDTSTGISAGDRAATIQALINPDSRPEDFIQPGHLFPLALPPGWRTGAARAYRGHSRSLPAGRPVPSRGCLRNHEGGRRDGPPPRPDPHGGAFLAQHPVHRGPHCLPSAT